MFIFEKLLVEDDYSLLRDRIDSDKEFKQSFGEAVKDIRAGKGGSLSKLFRMCEGISKIVVMAYLYKYLSMAASISAAIKAAKDRGEDDADAYKKYLFQINPYDVGADRYSLYKKFIEKQLPGGTLSEDYVQGIGEVVFVCGDNVKYIAKSTFKHSKITGFISGINTVRIAEDAFKDSVNLTDVTISKSVRYIGEGAFSGCSSLRKIEYNSESDFIRLFGADVGLKGVTIIINSDSKQRIPLSYLKRLSEENSIVAGDNCRIDVVANGKPVTDDLKSSVLSYVLNSDSFNGVISINGEVISKQS